jgi:hypothetical protein
MHARLFCILARDAPMGVILRRGPSEWVRLISWNTRTDRIDRGQWLHAHIYARRCDLSPDGRLMIYFCRDGRTGIGNYTAISKPPWFTALALWPQDHTWRGGGLFLTNTTVFLNQVGQCQPLADKQPRGLKIVYEQSYGPPGNSEDLGIYFPRLIRDGWEFIEHHQEGTTTVHTWSREHSSEPYRLIKNAYAGVDHPEGSGCYWDHYAIESNQRLPLADVDWADFDQKGRLVFARNGCLFAGIVTADGIDERLIADFNNEGPEPIASPASARRW